MPSLAPPFEHGTQAGYGYHKCRCLKCRAWNAEKGRQDRLKARTKLRTGKIVRDAKPGSSAPRVAPTGKPCLVCGEPALGDGFCSRKCAETNWRGVDGLEPEPEALALA